LLIVDGSQVRIDAMTSSHLAAYTRYLSRLAQSYGFTSDSGGTECQCGSLDALSLKEPYTSLNRS
jgi:hypothetical protein